MKHIYILIILLAPIISSCTRRQYVPVVTTRIDSVSVRDTVVEHVLVPYKDSVVTADTLSSLSNPYAYSRAEWRDGHLYHSLGIYPTSKVYIKVPYYIDRYRYVSQPEIIEVERPPRWWQKPISLLLIFAVGVACGVAMAIKW